MLTISTFYLSRVLGNKVIMDNQKIVGKLLDLIVDVNEISPKVIAAKVKVEGKIRVIDFSEVSIYKNQGQYIIQCDRLKEIEVAKQNTMFLKKHVLDKQIVDMDGRKVVRVNDLRLAILKSGTFTIAVDVGFDGLLRRIGIAKPIKRILKPFGIRVPSKMILWDDVASVDYIHVGLTLSKEHDKLSTLHPSDLADIIEEYDKHTQVAIFNSLDEERAADVLEELETDAQLHVLANLSVEKAADVLEKMPADEVADILDEMEEEDAEKLLNEMEQEVSLEVRELMEYPDDTVGSLMTTDYISLNQSMTVNETLKELRHLKPEPDTVYYLYIVDDNEKLIAIVSLRDIVISELDIELKEIMHSDVIYVYDYEKIGKLNEIITKYNLLSVPVVDKSMKMLGMVIINDVMDLIVRKNRN
ncbi:Mg/Co/Ni transporter MgtE with CBS domain [Desulfosporosinus acidiphilus SJ4]|uniref:Mg/Co/Ni transporter MgtE with CBS domain n=1 Tax=Desulfosporosinus acidiphilus (strain DSM 22704 / JCM 16185 / SJ4) TaxID=646529 RepID=I4D5N1_DESAJ|nr:CBS domain-containing protein [Desulfosporosinus acidiphilus]AFM41105.1 Mg/Co/Ni transporter MgtE with CBS domain [Desulfosporosinus acidiphilus SJ4]